MRSNRRKPRVALVGLHWGENFIDIYKNHPLCEEIALCQRDAAKLRSVCSAHGIKKSYASLEDILSDRNIDAVHIATPISEHAPMTIACLKAGKHVACAVPMASSIEECRNIIRTRRSTGKVYMMMETAVYRREFMHVKALAESGELGRIQFLRGSHLQDMDKYPAYWRGLPPMHYATHAVAPLSDLAGGLVESVVCFGSGKIRDEYVKYHNSSFSAESTLMHFKGSDVAAEVTRWLYDTARQYVESMDVYGEKVSFEWIRLLGDKPILFRKADPAFVDIPETTHLLPVEIAMFAKAGTKYDELGGSYPHLVNEFLNAIVEERDSKIDVEKAANWTCTGLCSHESAMSGGTKVLLPDFSDDADDERARPNA